MVSNRKANREVPLALAHFDYELRVADTRGGFRKASNSGTRALEGFSDSDRERVAFTANAEVYPIVDVILLVELESQPDSGCR